MTSLIRIRKMSLTSEEVYHEGGESSLVPVQVATASAVIENPYAGRYVVDLLPMMNELESLAQELATRLLRSFDLSSAQIEAYGKAAMVGSNGETEHAAMWHAPGGAALRRVIPGAKALVPGTTAIGGMGQRLTMSLGHIRAAFVRSHFVSIGVSIDDAPRPNELVFTLGASTGGRPHARIGGLQASEVVGNDGLR